ncbi:MAG: fumarylacetoacetate hydrolase family protein, partial [Verrucomicrobia bacterium]|nr:fumarylacetoacetate hydrolase family protein [Verrucomicrobiota bacterium]
MKLVRFGAKGRESPGVLVERAPEIDGKTGILNVRGMAFDIADYDRHFFERNGVERVRALCRESKRQIIPMEGLRLGAPVAVPGKILCVGKNYADHVKEFDSVMPEQPVFFAKASSSLNGPLDPVILPEGCEVVDSEVELAVVIGKQAKNIGEKYALDFIAGYTVLNDVTDRRAQKMDGQWHRAKSCDTFCPLGPWLVTVDEVRDPHSLGVRSKLDGKIVQNGNTGDM